MVLRNFLLDLARMLIEFSAGWFLGCVEQRARKRLRGAECPAASQHRCDSSVEDRKFPREEQDAFRSAGRFVFRQFFRGWAFSQCRRPWNRRDWRGGRERSLRQALLLFRRGETSIEIRKRTFLN